MGHNGTVRVFVPNAQRCRPYDLLAQLLSRSEVGSIPSADGDVARSGDRCWLAGLYHYRALATAVRPIRMLLRGVQKGFVF